MESALAKGYVVPNPGPPKTIGILNIVFGAILLLFVACQTASLLLFPAFQSMLTAQQKKMEADNLARQKEAIDAQLADLEKKEKEAKTEDEKTEIAAEREAIKNKPKPFTPNTLMGLDMAKDPKLVAYNIADLVTAFVLNVPMLISGIGLVRLSEWGRKVGLWTAWLKMLRAVVLGVVCVVLIVPVMTRKMGDEMDKMGTQIQAQQPNRPGAPPVRQTLRQAAGFVGVAMTAGYVGWYAACLIYPSITVWVLTRPRAKAAFLSARPAPEYLQ
jgi:hypothetical protein